MLPRDIFLGCCAPFLWAVNMIFMSWSLTDLSPLTFTTLRIVLVLPLCFLVKLRFSDLKYMWLVGLVWGCGHYGLLALGLKMGTPSYMASTLLQTTPLFTTLMGLFFFSDRVSLYKWLCILFSFCGVLFVYVPKIDAPFSWDYLIIILSALCMGVTNIFLKKHAVRLTPLTMIAWICLVSSVPLCILWYLFEPCTVMGLCQSFSLRLMGCLFFASWVSMVIGMKIWSGLLGKYPVANVTIFSFLVPVFNIILSYFLGEPMDWNLIPAFLTIVGGVAFLQFERPLKRFFKRHDPT